MFAPLPTSFPRLELLVQTMDALVVVSPPPIEAIGVRLRAAFERARASDYRDVSMSELRKLPFAYWVAGAEPLPVLEQGLVQRYWNVHLPQAIESGPRRAKRWLAPLFFTYCECFNPDDPWFLEFALRVEAVVARSEGAFADKLATLQGDIAFFRPLEVGPRLAKALVLHSKSLESALADHLLWPGFVDSMLGQTVLESAIANAEHNDGADIDELKVTTIYVEKGSVLKRFTARAKGRGDRISKQSCHVYVTVGN